MTDESDGTAGLAVVVEKPRAQRAIDAVRAAGVYDADRRVREYGDAAVAVPVTEVPEGVEYREVVRQVGEPRLRTLADHLRERGWTDDEIERAPSSWAVVGSVVLVAVGDAPRPEELGAALLALHGEADTVLARGGIEGPHREPDVTVLAGEGDTETVHHEHGTAYGLDLAEVMFSPGNKAERARMGQVIEAGERVLDMFAGIGYFTLPMARAGATVTAVERNPTAFRYLVENARRNGVTDRVRPYRADCREVAPLVAEDGRFDRAVLGYYDATEPDDDGGFAYLDPALAALAPGGVLHVHEATPGPLAPERPIDRLRAAADAAGRSVEVLDTREVKGYSEGVVHVVVDARVG
ncbi:MAG: class I SAM-dependent methyltransferase family protein [Haloarculaceae archaeon]